MNIDNGDLISQPVLVDYFTLLPTSYSKPSVLRQEVFPLSLFTFLTFTFALLIVNLFTFQYFHSNFEGACSMSLHFSHCSLSLFSLLLSFFLPYTLPLFHFHIAIVSLSLCHCFTFSFHCFHFNFEGTCSVQTWSKPGVLPTIQLPSS